MLSEDNWVSMCSLDVNRTCLPLLCQILEFDRLENERLRMNILRIVLKTDL